jgi:hypothetical protein
MLRTNVENSMRLNALLMGQEKLLINSRVLHLVPPVTSNLSSDFYPNKIIGQSIKNFIMNQKEKLKITPVFFSLIKIGTFDKSFSDMFRYNNSLDEKELQKYEANKEKSLDLIKKVMKMDHVEAAKNIWDVEKI